jgi:hypothetical protein
MAQYRNTRLDLDQALVRSRNIQPALQEETRERLAVTAR